MFKGLRVEHLIFTISMFVRCLGIQSQERNRIDEIVSSYPKNVKTVGEIGTRILSDFNLPQDRARAAFSWIAINISYDKSISEERNSKYAFSYKTEQEKKRKEIAFHDQLLTDVLKSRSAVCDGYSVLFERLCLFLGLESAVIRGTLKSDPSQIGNKELPLNHALNAVKINGKW